MYCILINKNTCIHDFIQLHEAKCGEREAIPAMGVGKHVNVIMMYAYAGQKREGGSYVGMEETRPANPLAFHIIHAGMGQNNHSTTVATAARQDAFIGMRFIVHDDVFSLGKKGDGHIEVGCSCSPVFFPSVDPSNQPSRPLGTRVNDCPFLPRKK